MNEKRIETLSRGVFIRDGRLLLCRTRGSGVAYLPGGHVEFCEQARSALVREIFEELGCSARCGRFLGICEHVFPQNGRQHAEINLVFEVGIFGINTENDPNPKESWLSFHWHPLTDLPVSGLEPAVLRAELPRWLNREDGGDRFCSSSGNGWNEGETG